MGVVHRQHTGIGNRAVSVIDNDILVQLRVAAGEGEVAVTDGQGAVGNCAKAGPAATGKGEILVVDLDVTGDHAAVGDRPYCAIAADGIGTADDCAGVGD